MSTSMEEAKALSVEFPISKDDEIKLNPISKERKFRKYKIYHCPICDIKIASKRGYQRHINEHSKDALKYLNQKLQGGQDDTN